MPTKFEVERVFKVWDNNSGAYFEIREDDDGLGFCTLGYNDKNTGENILLPGMVLEQAKMFAEELVFWCELQKIKLGKKESD